MAHQMSNTQRILSVTNGVVPSEILDVDKIIENYVARAEKTNHLKESPVSSPGGLPICNQCHLQTPLAT